MELVRSVIQTPKDTRFLFLLNQQVVKGFLKSTETVNSIQKVPLKSKFRKKHSGQFKKRAE